MTKEQVEHISIIMETIAFFFVTLDLYGKERLTKLRNKLSNIRSERMEEVLFNRTRVLKVFSNSCFIIGILLIIDIQTNYFTNQIPPKISNYVLGFLEDHKSIILGRNFLGFITGYILTIVPGIILTMLIYYFMTVFPLIGVYYLSIFASKISRLFPIQGIMLAIGVTLFVLAKLMQYFLV
jgi:hypothetical protein